MILVICPKCALTIRVIGEVDEVHHLVGEASEFYPDRYPCPQCQANSFACAEFEVPTSELARLRVRDLTAQEALVAFNGLGLPDEHVCTKAVLETLLRERPIRRIDGQDIEGSSRCYLHHIELWDGTKIYFGAGSGGAVVYRIASPPSYTQKASHDVEAG
jgi:hypothetical protein